MIKNQTVHEHQFGLCFMLLCMIVAMTGVYAQKQEKVQRVLPDDDLQQVLDGAIPGEIIILAPGSYGGFITIKKGGDAGAPVIIRAEESGTVTLTNAMLPEFKLNFVNVKGDLFRAPVPWQVRWVMVEGHRNLMDYVTLGGLETFRAMGNDNRRMNDGPPEGFVWENGFLYIRLLGGEDPNQAGAEIHRETNVFDEKTYTLWGLSLIHI